MFKKIPGFPNYSVDEHGNVRSDRRGIIRSLTENQFGYLQVTLHDSGERTTFRVHRLVALTFIPNPDNKPQVNHKDGNKKNNHVSNLEWATSQENIFHAFENGLIEPERGEDRHWDKITNEQVHEVCKLLQEGKSGVEVEENTGVHYKTISNIRTKNKWRHISDLYDFKVSTQPRLSKETVRDICEKLQEGLSVSDISKMAYGVTYSAIRKIYKRQSHKDISKDFSW